MKKIKYSEYFDKVYGCWLGKSIGGACGALSENNKNILNYTMENVFPDVIPPNDDLDLQVLWLTELLEKKGTALTSCDFAEAFKEKNLCLANEYSVAIRNITGGIMPPLSGEYLNDFFKNSMGCPIRSEIWATAAPASIETVKKYVAMDGCIDHTDESIYLETFNAVMESLAFFEDDLVTLVKTALKEIPEDCRVAEAVSFVLEQYQSGADWKTARNKLILRFGSHDASYCIPNCVLTLLSLLYGEKDYTKTLLYSVNGGFDTDCTAATALSIVGIIGGAENTPKFWLDKIGDELVVGTVDIDCPYKTIKSFAEATCRAGLSFMRDGLLDIEITDIPEDITPSLPKTSAKSISITAEYSGAPVIAPDEEKRITVILTNNSNENICDTLNIEVAEALECDKTAVSIGIAAGETAALELTFRVKSDARYLPLDNINTVCFGDESFKIGINGAYLMHMIGPFWDNYDTAVFDSDPYCGRTQKNIGETFGVRAMFNGFVNADREYIDESFESLDDILAGRTDIPCKKTALHGDIFDIDKDIAFKGSVCVYLVFDFIADKPCKGDFHFGNTTPFKAWQNGKLICEDNGIHSWMPYNTHQNRDAVNIKEGFNRIVFKLTRQDAFKFSFTMRNGLDNARLFHDFKSII